MSICDSKCERLVETKLIARMDDIRKLWALYQQDYEAYDGDLGNLDEYGLCFNYVDAGTFDDRREGYFCWQLSWGGPGDEFRFFGDFGGALHRIEYWYLDWFDGACRNLGDDDFNLLKEIFNNYLHTT